MMQPVYCSKIAIGLIMGPLAPAFGSSPTRDDLALEEIIPILGREALSASAESMLSLPSEPWLSCAYHIRYTLARRRPTSLAPYWPILDNEVVTQTRKAAKES
ncbi:hypothetical protein EI94DRAFT_1732297 [Lactarius quietus]|nr:hypothetical protein EI94DRAFT_1732297 [Lactarius quietus]